MSVILVTQRHDQFTAVQELRAVRAACGSVTRPLVPPLPARSAPLVAKLFLGARHSVLGRQDQSWSVPLALYRLVRVIALQDAASQSHGFISA